MLARLAKAFPNLVMALAAGILAPQTALAQNFITVDYPGGTLNEVRQINNHGEMAGRYVDAEGVYHGFVVQNGVVTPINFPGALGTAVWGINDNGDLVGRYEDAEGITNHGFLFSNGVFTTIDPPGSTWTFAEGINGVGQIVGYFIDAGGHNHGFLLSAGTYSTIDFPGSVLTNILKVDNVGAMVGYYDDSSGNEHGLLFQNGSFISFDYPDAFFTDGFGINDGGQIVGYYAATATSNTLGFEDNNGIFTTINFPAAVDGLAVEDINDAGQLAGAYIDATGMEHGFVSATGPFAYVANIDSNSVSMIDIPTSLPVTTIPVGSGPLGVAVSPDGKQVYISNNHGNNISVIDTATSSVIATIPVQSAPLALAFTPDGTAVYVVNGSSNSVSVINTSSQTVTATVPVQSSPWGIAMAVTSKGTFAYVTNSGSNNVSVIAVGANPSVVQTINVGSDPQWSVVSPDNTMVYVENTGSNNVSVLSVASNTVTATIPVGTGPVGAAFSPDSSTAYVTEANSLAVINTSSSTVINTIPGFNIPFQIALTPDGSSAYVTNLGNSTVSVVNTASNTITATVPVGSAPIGVAMAAAPATVLQVTLPLSPTQPNTFGFGTNNFVVQYPAGSSFSGVNMTVTAVEITPAQFAGRVAGTQFSGATCIVYSGTGGNCVDYEVTCSDTNGNQISCPSETAPTIAVQTSFETLEQVVNPGFLTTPIGQNQWTNIFTGYTDPTVKGKTQGFSEFVAVNLAITNPQGAASIEVLEPNFPRFYSGRSLIQVTIKLTSVTTGKPITNARGSMSVVMVADSNGNPTQQLIFSKLNCFKETDTPGVYKYNLQTNKFPVGSYSMTIYGDSFAAQERQFKIPDQAGAGRISRRVR
jgi:YVTN family beta-propeller protein/probable HAF family extracellular repeat protein